MSGQDGAAKRRLQAGRELGAPSPSFPSCSQELAAHGRLPPGSRRDKHRFVPSPSCRARKALPAFVSGSPSSPWPHAAREEGAHVLRAPALPYPGLLEEQQAVFVQHRLRALQQLCGHGFKLLIHCKESRRRGGGSGGVLGTELCTRGAGGSSVRRGRSETHGEKRIPGHC